MADSQTIDPHAELRSDIAWAQGGVDDARKELREADFLLATLQELLATRMEADARDATGP